MSNSLGLNLSGYPMVVSSESDSEENFSPHSVVSRDASSESKLASRDISDETLVGRLNPITGFTLKEFVNLKSRRLVLINSSTIRAPSSESNSKELSKLNTRLIEYQSMVTLLRESPITIEEIRRDNRNSLRCESKMTSKGAGAGSNVKKSTSGKSRRRSVSKVSVRTAARYGVGAGFGAGASLKVEKNTGSKVSVRDGTGCGAGTGAGAGVDSKTITVPMDSVIEITEKNVGPDFNARKRVGFRTRTGSVFTAKGSARKSFRDSSGAGAGAGMGAGGGASIKAKSDAGVESPFKPALKSVEENFRPISRISCSPYSAEMAGLISRLSASSGLSSSEFRSLVKEREMLSKYIDHITNYSSKDMKRGVNSHLRSSQKRLFSICERLLFYRDAVSRLSSSV